MAFELVGIDNENGFYPAAFLTDALEEELKAAISRWRDERPAAETPDIRLAKASESYLKAVDRIRTLSSAKEIQDNARKATTELLLALGYEPRRQTVSGADDALIPVLARQANRDGRDHVWVIEAPLPIKGDEASDPLMAEFDATQFGDEDQDAAAQGATIEEVLSRGVFELDAPPRYVLLLGLRQLVLIDRAKWPSRALLRFDLIEIFRRADPSTLGAMACFAAREARAPETGTPLAERLEEEAQRHANAVTASLKKTVREAIELLGNEVLAVTGGKYPSGKRKGVWIEDRDLTIECLRYMYRLLFLFYAEANPRLGIIPLNDPIYRKGYSLEALRGLETKKLRTEEEKKGAYLWDSLQRLLGLMYEGLDKAQIAAKEAFTLPRVRVSLLDPDSTPILSQIKLRNEAVQKIIRLLSLKTDKAGTGRISYAQLGIGQLGAVYETLISFTGFVAKTDLIELIPPKGRGAEAEDDETSSETEDEDESESAESEVQEEDAPSRVDKVDPLAPSYFVPRSRSSEFTREQIVYDGPQPRIYPKGTFIYRLAGRDRQKSASYYTPEPLARLLVKHALMERCKGMDPDEILELKILEPAMGSAAFLVETTNQLAELYLERKQEEIGERIPQEKYFEERQKVRAFIADRNCFGVDLNPIAVELGQISLWLNGLHSSEFSPWFGDQLHAGNSLIGARRAAYGARSLKTKKAEDLWMKTIPEEIGWREVRKKNYVWQFLLPAQDMAKFDTDKSIAALAKNAQDKIKAWRRSGFFAPFEEHEIKLLLDLSSAVDELFESVAADLRKARADANDEITIYPGLTMLGVKGTDFHAKLQKLKVLQGDEHVSNSLPYQRLKTAMDAWCALWLWPLEKADFLPSRREYLLGLQTILKGGFTQSGELELAEEGVAFEPAQGDLLERQARADKIAQELPSYAKQSSLFQATNIDALVSAHPWLKVAREVADRERFTHFDLIFADVLKDRHGFDVIVGNPPWAKPSWNEGLILADLDPLHMGRSATEARSILAEALAKIKCESAFLQEFVSTRGAMAVTSSAVMNPYAGGGSNNLYRCFVDLAFRLTAPKGYAALIHQDGHLSDPKSGGFRTHWYGRIAKHFDISNKITSKNFSEVVDHVRFSLNVYRGVLCDVSFDQVTMAFLASQIDESYAHEGGGEAPTIKGADGYWDTRGHRDRLIRIDNAALAVIHALAEESTVVLEETRFIQPFSSRMLDVFRQLSIAPKLDSAISPASAGSGSSAGWQMSSCWNETTDQKRGVIRREPRFRDDVKVIIQGPMIHVGNPFYKSPRALGRTNADYDVVDLTLVRDDYQLRSNFGPGADFETYKQELPPCNWDASKKHTSFYRLGFRKRVNLNSERSLVPAMLAPSWAHLFTIESAAFKREGDLLNAHALSISLLADFFVKASGRVDFQSSALASLPWIDCRKTAKHRALRLACLSRPYATLWNSQASKLDALPWSSDDLRLALEGSVQGPTLWDRTAALRTEFARRMALVEIDVLVAQAFGLTLDQLIEIYRIYFPVLQENEAGTWYDQKGRIVWTCSKGLPGVGYLLNGKSPGRKAWETIAALEPTELVCEAIDDTQPGGPRKITRRFVGPFTQHDRVDDYRRAWAHFESFKSQENAA